MTYGQSETSESLVIETSAYSESPTTSVPQVPWNSVLIGLLIVLMSLLGYIIGKGFGRAEKSS
jgi:hypothetical protein